MTSIDEINKILDDLESIQLEFSFEKEQKNESARPNDQETDNSCGQNYIEAEYVDGKENWFDLQN